MRATSRCPAITFSLGPEMCRTRATISSRSSMRLWRNRSGGTAARPRRIGLRTDAGLRHRAHNRHRHEGTKVATGTRVPRRLLRGPHDRRSLSYSRSACHARPDRARYFQSFESRGGVATGSWGRVLASLDGMGCTDPAPRRDRIRCRPSALSGETRSIDWGRHGGWRIQRRGR